MNHHSQITRLVSSLVEYEKTGGELCIDAIAEIFLCFVRAIESGEKEFTAIVKGTPADVEKCANFLSNVYDVKLLQRLERKPLQIFGFTYAKIKIK